MAKRLEASPVLSPGYFAIRDTVMHRLGGGTMREIPWGRPGLLQCPRRTAQGVLHVRRLRPRPLFEEPERFRRILREDVLTGRKTLADDPVAQLKPTRAW